MRIPAVAVRGLGAYPFPNYPVRLVDGREIADPENTFPSAADCLPYQCGADSANQAARMWCSFHGQVGSRSCMDPACEPWRSQIPGCNLTYTLPALVNGTLLVPPHPPAAPPVLTPQSIVQPLPDIAAMLAPVAVASPRCSVWCDLNAAIQEHPLIALAILAAGAALIWRKK
jgi:hypothetical protein